jgi:predicted dehydrogenase
LAAIRAGKHVLCEMPLAPSLAEADELAAEAEKQGVLLMPGLNFRYTPNYVKAKELIDSGELGKVCAVLYREFIPAKDLARQWPADSWVWNLKESGGPLFTLSVWSIDLLRWLLGTEVAELNAATKYTVLEQFGGTLGYDSCVSLKLASGVVGCLQYSGSVSDPAASSALEVIGDNNRLLNASGNDTVEVLGQDPAKIQWNVKAPGAKMWGHYQQNQHFAQCIQEGRTPDITLQDGRKAMELALQIATS